MTHPAEGKLLPCPFCGAQPTTDRAGVPGKFGPIPTVRCTNEECFGPHTTAQFLADAVKQWNTRHSQGGNEVPKRETHWLVERMGHGQYVKHGAAGTRHDLTDNVWHAERFANERVAFDFVRLSESPWAKELRAVEHMFINKAQETLEASGTPLARSMATASGHDPDEYAPLTEMCTADNKPVFWWKVFEEQAEQLKELFDNTHNVFVVDDRDKVTAMLTGLDLAAIKKALASPPPASVSSPAESVIKPTDANISVLIEALYHCGCPAGGMTVGECAEQGVCGCSIRAERIKGCMGPDHQYFSREESQP